MAKQPRASPRISRSKCHAKAEAGGKTSLDSFRKCREDDTPDKHYLEVVEEMLRRRENNGRDRDESVGAAKDND